MVQLLRSLISKNLKSWEDLLPYVEFAYNRAVHSTTHTSPFEIVYGFNPLSPIDLISLPISNLVSADGISKADLVQKMHKQVKDRIEKQNEKVATRMNRGKKRIVFRPGDWVWVHFRKERFPTQRKSKLSPRGDGPFQVLERINDNAYKIDLKGEYNVSGTFNVADLTPFDVGDELDSRTNHPKEGGNVTDGLRLQTLEDADFDGLDEEGRMHVQDPLSLSQGPITRSRAKKLQETLNGYIQGWANLQSHSNEDSEEWALYNILKAHIQY